LLEACRRSLSPGKRLADVIIVDALPAGRAGKLDRRALRAAVAGNSAAFPAAAR
jgi:acyl-CoA synthetase (AMP-forming)/AMP-acid ligase II